MHLRRDRTGRRRASALSIPPPARRWMCGFTLGAASALMYGRGSAASDSAYGGLAERNPPPFVPRRHGGLRLRLTTLQRYGGHVALPILRVPQIGDRLG